MHAIHERWTKPLSHTLFHDRNRRVFVLALFNRKYNYYVRARILVKHGSQYRIKTRVILEYRLDTGYQRGIRRHAKVAFCQHCCFVLHKLDSLVDLIWAINPALTSVQVHHCDAVDCEIWGI